MHVAFGSIAGARLLKHSNVFVLCMMGSGVLRASILSAHASVFRGI